MKMHSLRTSSPYLVAGILATLAACTDIEVPEYCEDPGPELCGNNIDDDCDGEVDEPSAIDALTWYQDCDVDGFASLDAEVAKACNGPRVTRACQGWTLLEPSSASNTIDCNDLDANYHPFAKFKGEDSAVDGNFDFNCDGKMETAPYLVGAEGKQYSLCEAPNACDCYAAVDLSEESAFSAEADDALTLPLECGAPYSAVHRVRAILSCNVEQGDDAAILVTGTQLCR